MQRGPSTVVKLGGKQAQGVTGKKEAKYVELSRETTDRVFVILAEFGNTRHPSLPRPGHQRHHPGTGCASTARRSTRSPSPTARSTTRPSGSRTTTGRTTRRPTSGPAPRPSRSRPTTRSSRPGRYSVDGEVTNWVRVQYNEARYGRSNGFPCAGNVCSNTWNLVQDAANKWYADQLAAGRPAAEVNAELATFDQWDRYDYDNDGNFNEPDGYIDHFQIVHAGGDQADGDPWQGEDADLVAPLEDLPGHRPGPGGQPRRRQPDRQQRHLDRRLHDPAGERRPERVLPRVRPRPRSAGRLQRPVRRRQQQRALDPDGPEPARRQGRAVHRRPRRRPGCLEQAPARLARLRDPRGRRRVSAATGR